MPQLPGLEYGERLRARRSSHHALARTDAQLSAARLAVFGAGILVAALSWRGGLSGWWLVLPLAAFVWLLARHDVVIRAREAARRAIAFYERGVARLEDRWAGLGDTGDRFRDDTHLYANDLDLFGRGSLFDLLSIARTRAGEETLAAWLKSPAAPDELSDRRTAVDELAPALDLRERLALAGTDVRAGVDGDALKRWAEAPATLQSLWLRAAAVALTAAAIVTASFWASTGSSGPLLVVIGLEILFSLPLRGRIEKALHAADGPARDLDVLAHLLTDLESQAFQSPRLRALHERLVPAGLRASTAIHRLHTLVERHDWQHNLIFAMVSPIVLWGTHLAFAIERWRERHGRHVGVWLDAVGECEALSSLATYRYEHPEDPFPDLTSGPAAFEGTALGHPLVPAARMVRNDVRLADDTRLLVVSGSNMSGKSTLLRTVGINAVLAFAGAPVRADRLRMTPLVIGATLRIQDSLQEGRSRFYAEISRVKALSELAAGTPPLLFLLDELFHGTNSHDRLVGAAGVLRSLVDRGAIGLVTTHDLALTNVVTDLGGRAANVHFDDRLEGGEMVFDYRMKPGPVTRSNAIALMRAVGLDVKEDG